MNNLEEKIKEIEKQLEELKGKLTEEDKYKRPRYNNYWFLNNLGEAIMTFDYDEDEDNFCYSIGNYFETEKEAKNYKEKLLIEQELRDIATELNKGEEIDWNDGSQDKYYLLYSFYADGPMRDSSSNYSKKQGIIYCLDSDFINIAIERIGEERLKKYLKGELD